MNQPASFAVRLNGAQGKMEATVHSPSGALDECAVTELEKGERERACEREAAFTYELWTMSRDSGPDVILSWPFTHVSHKRSLSVSDTFPQTGSPALFGRGGMELGRGIQEGGWRM